MIDIKILLIVLYSDGMWMGLEEIGISSICSFLRQSGEDVRLIGTKEEKLDYNELLRFQPDFIGFVIYETSKNVVFHVAEKIKEFLPACYLVAGGIYTTCVKEKLLEECPQFDYVITGEGEESFGLLLKAAGDPCAMDQVPGLIYRGHDGIHAHPQPGLLEDLNALPFPSRDILVDNKLKVAQISGSRGCTGRCDFCSSQLFRKKWIGRTPQNIGEEIETIHHHYGIHIFNFIDCSFEDPGVNYERVYAIADEIIRRGLVISFMANFRPSFYKKAQDALMSRLKEAGLLCGFIGIEAGNDEDLRQYNKRTTVVDNVKTFQLFARHDINVQPGFINFNPFSTMQTVEANYHFLDRYDLLNNMGLIANRYRMYPGTRLSVRVEKEGLLDAQESNMEIAYHFQDQRVEHLCRYIERLLTPHYSLFPLLSAIENYASMYRLVTAHYTNVYRKRLCMDAVDAVALYRAQSDTLLKKINGWISRWYGALIELAKDGWQESAADTITEKLLDKARLEDAVQNLNRIRNHLNKALISGHPELSFYVVSSF